MCIFFWIWPIDMKIAVNIEYWMCDMWTYQTLNLNVQPDDIIRDRFHLHFTASSSRSQYATPIRAINYFTSCRQVYSDTINTFNLRSNVPLAFNILSCFNFQDPFLLSTTNVILSLSLSLETKFKMIWYVVPWFSSSICTYFGSSISGWLCWFDKGMFLIVLSHLLSFL